MGGLDGVHWMNPEETVEEPEPIPPEPPPEELPPPPPPDAEPPPPEKQHEAPPSEDAWEEAYDELIEPDEKPKRRKKKFRHWGAVIVTVGVIIFLVAWTLVSPDVLNPVGDAYTDSPTYARWGSYNGTRDIWAGETTWGVSVSGRATSAGNRSIQVDVLITKVSENPGNWFFRGTGIELRNVSLFTEDGTYIASMSNQSDLGFGISASIPATFASAGVYELYVTVRFLVNEVMRIGFLPLETVNIQAVYLNLPIVVE